MLAQRIIYGTLAIVTLVAIFLVDITIAQASSSVAEPLGRLLERGSLVPLFIASVFMAGSWELAAFLRKKNYLPYTWFAIAMVGAMILSPWLSAAGFLGQSPAAVEGVSNVLLLLGVATMGTGMITVFRGNPAESLSRSAATLFIVLYIGLLGSFAVQLRCGRDIPGEQGAWLLLIVALVTKSSDIGAFFVGSALGRHKLAPRISPAKTVEGFLGGLAGSAAAAVGIWYLGSWAGATVGAIESAMILSQPAAAPVPSSFYESLAYMLNDATECFQFGTSRIMAPIWCAGVFGLIMSVSGQVGDLLESCFKRDADMKDSGQIIPRFGGILDLVDSPLMAIPVAWFLLTAVWEVV
ncbi:MAG: phosphatidate cytidylyltransferase [Phycisphaerae bacterium]